MYKTPIRHKRRLTLGRRKSPLSDVDKIKAYLYETTQGIKDSAENGFASLRKQSVKTQRYLAKRPIKVMGASLVTGLLAGICIGYFSNK